MTTPRCPFLRTMNRANRVINYFWQYPSARAEIKNRNESRGNCVKRKKNQLKLHTRIIIMIILCTYCYALYPERV